jgi:hypothetical protein
MAQLGVARAQTFTRAQDFAADVFDFFPVGVRDADWMVYL